MCVDRGCRAPRAEGGQCQRHGRLRRVAVLRRETRADGGAGRGITHPDGGPSVYGSLMSEQPEWYERILELQLRENPEIWARFQEEGIDEDELRLGFIYLAPSETAANE